MRVIVCHTGNINPEAAEALEKYAPKAEYVDTSGSIYAYNEAIASRWDGSDDLVVIEQDKVITADVLPTFEACEESRQHFWCAYSYDVFPPPYTKEVSIGLGCTKYSWVVQRLVKPEEFLGPDSECLPKCPHCQGKGCWLYLDSRIGFAVMNRMIQVSVHGKIKHHHEYSPDWAKQVGLEK